MDLASGILEKMEIIAYSDENFSTEKGRIKVELNPNGYQQTKKHNYVSTPVIGAKNVARFSHEENEKQTFEFLFDNTLISPTHISTDVKTRVDALTKLVYSINGSIHKPNQLLLSWGALQFKCFCESIQANYTHFNLAGSPVRAKVKVDFVQKITHKQHQSETQSNSPDMTHYKLISAGVNLPQIANEIYRDPSYCIELAAFNQLDTFRNLPEGKEIIAPPLKN